MAASEEFIQDIRSKKEKLEKNILYLIQEFEKDTGMLVSFINN